MKIERNAKIILILVLLNICAVALVYLVFSASLRVRTANLDNPQNSIALPYLPKAVAQKINVGSHAYIVYDPKTRAIVAGKNEHLRFAPASTAKIMTATIVLETFSLDKVLTAQDVDQVQGSKMDLTNGEKMIVENLLYGLMLPSGNDAAHVFAANYPGGVGAFVNRMNSKAHDLKLENTKFIDPAGYEDENYTTAFDLARLGAYAIGNPAFAKIVSTRTKTVTDISGKIEHKLVNLNELLGVDGVTGIKTGFTDEAGEVLVTSVAQKDRTYIIVVLNSPDRFGDTKNVIEQALKRIHVFSY